MRTLKVDPAGEVARFLRCADPGPVLVATDEAVFQVVKMTSKQAKDLEKDNAESLRSALRESAGAIAGVDLEELKSELRDQRQQDTSRRPA
jgi:hypothetical protein